MEDNTNGTLDDLRKRRLAYFETSVSQTSQEDTFDKISSHQEKELLNKHGRINEKFLQKNKEKYKVENEQIEESKRCSLQVKAVTTENLDSNENCKNKVNTPVNTFGEERTDKKSDANVKGNQFETKVDSSLKTTSFYIQAEEAEKHRQLENFKHERKNVQPADGNLYKANTRKDDLTIKDVKNVKHVHYDDGYNETVERLIKATKEELLGKEVQDNIWSDFMKQQNNTAHKISDNNSVLQEQKLTHFRKDPRAEFQEIPVYCEVEPRRHSATENANLNQNATAVDYIFESEHTQCNNSRQTNLSLQESHDNTDELGQSQDFAELGLSTHRPDSGKEDEILSIETHGVQLDASLTRQLRYALGEEKFKEFIEKSRKDIDVIQQERVSARTEKEQKVEKPARNLKDEVEGKASFDAKEARDISSNKIDEFTPRNDGDAVQEMIGEHILKKKEPRQKLTSNPAYKQKNPESNASDKPNAPTKAVPELNLKDVNDSPRPLLNRPRHEPFNIYQEKSNRQMGKKPEKAPVSEEPIRNPVKNYEQVTVSRNVVFSADEIYYQAYGVNPQEYTEHLGVPESPHGVQIIQQGMPVTPHGILVNSQGASMNPSQVPNGIPLTPHGVPLTPHGIPVTPHSMTNGAFISSHGIPMSPHYPSTPSSVITPVSIPSSVALSLSGPMSQKQYNAPIPPQFISSLVGPPVEPGGKTAPIQSAAAPGSVQVPHPPSYPPPTYTQAQQFSQNLGFGTAVTQHYVSPSLSSEHYQIPQPMASDMSGMPVQQGIQHLGYPVAYPVPYPVMVMTPHPPVEPMTPSKVADKTHTEEKSTVTDKVEEETTFTSVSQIQPQEEEVKVPHPPPTKKQDKRRSPRKVAVPKITIPDREAKRHIDGIRHHHEQRRLQQEDEKLTEAQIIEKQKKFAKASIERYFQSLENLYKSTPNSNVDSISDVLSESSNENDDHLVEEKLQVIPELDVVSNEIQNNEKLNEIFKTTKPDNFTIPQMSLNTGLKEETNTYEVKADTVDKAQEKLEQIGVKSTESVHDIINEIKPKAQEISYSLDDDTLVNTAVTGFSVEAGGLTGRLNELGIDAKYVKGDVSSTETTQCNEDKHEGQKLKKDKSLIICPECEGFNKDYMSWCTHCGEMIIGVEPVLVSKNRQGKIRTKPFTVKSAINSSEILPSDKIDKVDENEHTEVRFPVADDENYEKPLKLDLGYLKSSKDVSDTKLNVSPNKSDGKDSGRPSSDDQELINNINNKIEQEVEDDICETITDPVVKGYVKSHFAKRRQAMQEHKLLPADDSLKSKVQSWIEEIESNDKDQIIAQTKNAHETSSLKDKIHTVSPEEENHDKQINQRLTEKEKAAESISADNNTLHFKVSSKSESFVDNTVHEEETNNLHFDTSPSLKEDIDPMFMPPDIPKFGASLTFDPSELALKLTSDSMDFSQLGSLDFSQVEHVNVRNEKELEEMVKSDKMKAKQERRRKKGHGAIDVEVFGYEESRECKNSSRGQRLVPILKLPDGSSDEEDMSDQQDEQEKTDNEKAEHTEDDKENVAVPQTHYHDMHLDSNEDSNYKNIEGVQQSLAMTAWQSVESGDEYFSGEHLNGIDDKDVKDDIPALVRPQESTDDWQLIFDPSLANDEQEETNREEESSPERDQPFLMQLIGKQSPKGKKPKSSKGKPVKSKVRQSIEGPGYQRKWARSSTAWSSYNPGELKTSSSLKASIDVQGQNTDRSEGQDFIVPNDSQRERSGSPVRQVARKKRPVSAISKRRSSEGQGPSSDRGDGHDLTVANGNLSERSGSPLRQAGNKKRPASADVYKRKQQKQRPVSASLRKAQDRNQGNKDKNDDKLYNLVEHRLPRRGIQELLQDRMWSPRSTYDKYLEMTPRIHEGTLSYWQCLPDEILIHIFAYLSQSDLTSCALVCHQFYRVAMDESLWKYITIKKKTDLDDTCLMEISKRHPVSLALIHCHGDQITASGLRDMFRECADSLKELNISRCSRGALLGDSILLHAAARCHNITHIDTSWCNVTDSGLMAMSNSSNRLESLCINGCQAISNDGLETITKKHGSSLRVLEMFGCFNITPRGLQAVSNNCINLISLHLGQCYKLTDSSIAQLSSSLGRVETLDLRGCKQLKDNCIRRVVKNCTRLKHLSLANCPNITDVSVLEISTYLTDIRSIDLCGCKNITDSSIRALVNTCTNLRHLDISSTGCTNRSVSMIANFCSQRLESLRINFLSDVTEASIIKLAKHCRRLTSVHLYGCPSVKNLDKIKEERPTFTIEM